MKLSKLCIHRPVFAVVLSLLIIVLGIVGYSYLEVRYFPKISEKTATIKYSLEGASPSLMRDTVAVPVENALNGINNLQKMVSSSSYGSTQINLTFYPSTNMTMAMGDIRDALSGIDPDALPTGILPPNVTNGGVARSVLTLGFVDSSMSSGELRDYVIKYIQPLFENIPGMGGVWLNSSGAYAMRIWLDPQKMAAFGITTKDIQDMLTSNNITFSGGSVRGDSQNYSIVSSTALTKVDEFKNLILRDDSGSILRLKDVATVKMGNASLDDRIMKINGQVGLRMELRPIDTANPITVAKLSAEKIKEVRRILPKGMSMFQTYNQSTFLKNSIADSYHTLFEAIILVMLVVFLFLGSIRAALIPILTIPVCVIGAFGVMLLCGFSINIVTLLAIILAIGLVVDDAIVVLENVHRHIEMGKPPKDAALIGSAEIGFSVIAMTITLAAVYAPIGFLTGLTASIFREFAFTLAGAVLISGFVALTLSPMMCAFILKSKSSYFKYETILENIFDNLNDKYRLMLKIFLNKKKLIIGFLFALLMLCFLLFNIISQAFIPKEDIGYLEANSTSPPNSTVPYTDYYTNILNNLIFNNSKDIENNSTLVFSGRSVNFITLKPWGERKISSDQLMKSFSPLANKIPGIQVSFSVPDPVSYGSDADEGDIVLYLGSFKDSNYLLKYSDKILKELKSYAGIHNVNSDLKFNTMAYNISFNRDMAASLGVNLQDIADTFSILMSGKHITNVLSGNQTYQVIVQMDQKDLASFKNLNKIYVASKSGEMIPLANLVSIKKEVRQSSLTRYKRMNSAKITANISPGYELGDVYKKIQSLLSSDMGKISVSYGGRIAAFVESNGTMLGLFLLALVFIYLVLAAQFESFVDPFIILLTVPLSLVGALFTMYLTGGTLNLFTNIGLITLLGLISKHGILITQFSNESLKNGLTLYEAVMDGAVTRLRPILMTTCAMVLGSIPLAFSSGPGSIAKSMLGYTLVGGLIFGTVFSLVIIPIAYVLLSPLDHKKKRLLKSMKG